MINKMNKAVAVEVSTELQTSLTDDRGRGSGKGRREASMVLRVATLLSLRQSYLCFLLFPNAFGKRTKRSIYMSFKKKIDNCICFIFY